MSIIGSYHNGFAPRDAQPLYPELWRGCVGAWAPCLGPTGLTLRDWSGYGYHGTLNSMSASTAWAVVGGRYCLDFDNINDNITTSGNPTINTRSEMTVALWVNSRSPSSSDIFIGCDVAGNRSWYIGVSQLSASKLNFVTGGGPANLTGTSNLTANTWTHVAVTVSVSRNVDALYVNGVLEASGTASSPLNIPGTLYIGQREFSGFEQYYDGRLDDIGIYNRALSGNEIKLRALRRGIAYDLAPRKRSRVFTGGFKAYWAARKAQILGGGL